MQIFSIEVKDMIIEPVLIQALLRDYFNKMQWNYLEISVEEIKGEELLTDEQFDIAFKRAVTS